MSGSDWSIAMSDLALRHGDDRALLLGGQVHNSSSSSTASIHASFAHARRMNANTVLAPVSWALLEPEEGAFDFTLVDEMVRTAQSLDLRLVPLWFGAFKNAASTYAPRWVRADERRFPRAVVSGDLRRRAFDHDGATPAPVLSVFGEEVRGADAAAFVAVMSRISQTDSTGVVALVQVENESGLLGDSRDRGPLARAAWTGQVPLGLIEAARGAAPDSPLHRLWVAGGRHPEGDWAAVFGENRSADEIFMAWAFGSYVEHLASRGQAVKAIPMYTNAWLGPQPGQSEPGEWPSGGPASRVIDVWRAAAPSLALVGPDIYVDDADSAMRSYATGEQPLFIPESRLRAGELVRAIGTHRAIGWSAFGIDGANPDGQTAAVLGYLTRFERAIADAQGADRIGALVIEPGGGEARAHVGDLIVSGRGLNDLVRNFLLDTGVQLPDEAPPVSDETLPGEPVPTPGEQRPFALVYAEEDGSLLVIGQGVKVDFATTRGGRVEVDSVVELLLSDGDVVPGRVLNGDERLQIVPVDRVGAARITLLRFP